MDRCVREFGLCDMSFTSIYIGDATISREAEVVYEDPDSVQQYIPKRGDSEDIELKECPAYGESREKHKNIDLSGCPAYGVA